MNSGALSKWRDFGRHPYENAEWSRPMLPRALRRRSAGRPTQEVIHENRIANDGVDAAREFKAAVATKKRPIASHVRSQNASGGLSL